MKNSENLEWKKVNLSNNKKKKIQEKSAWDLWKCLREPNIKDVLDWIDDSPVSTYFKHKYSRLAETLKKSKDIEEYKNNMWYEISSVLINIETIKDYLIDAQLWNPTWDIEYLIKVVKGWLKKIKNEKEHNLMYQGFVIEENSNLEKLEWKFAERIGEKKRGDNGIYE